MFPTSRRNKFFLLFLLSFCSQVLLAQQQHLFFIHNRYLEMVKKDVPNDEYGLCEYDAILNKFQRSGFVVHSEIRKLNTDMRQYASKITKQVQDLLDKGVKPRDITVVGTSKGGAISMLVSTMLKNDQVNFVFVGCCWHDAMTELPEVDFHGHVLSIFDQSDSLGRSCMGFHDRSKHISSWKEIELHTGIKHGYLYKAMDQWMEPAIAWARQKHAEHSFTQSIDSILANGTKPFNGIVVVNQAGATLYAKASGFADPSKKEYLQLNDRFVIGSISKQMTAVMVLQAYDKGLLRLDVPIRRYLPDIKFAWADTVTVHHLLTHTHGIDEAYAFQRRSFDSLPPTLSFTPGTKYSYSQLGFKLLADIVAAVEHKPFSMIVTELFRSCGMKNSFYPNDTIRRLSCYLIDSTGAIRKDNTGMPEGMYPAGGYVSTANDLIAWNAALFEGKLLKPATFKMMCTEQKNAVRDHPIFGKTYYGYGLTIDRAKGALRLGQTGYGLSFISENFYFPATKTSVIVLCNAVPEYLDNANKFCYHTAILDLVHRHLNKDEKH